MVLLVNKARVFFKRFVMPTLDSVLQLAHRLWIEEVVLAVNAELIIAANGQLRFRFRDRPEGEIMTGRGFVREYINKSACDLVIGVPAGFRALLTTSPYYRSSYVFVIPQWRGLKSVSFDSPELRTLKIGVQVLDENYAPPGTALARRGLQSEIVGFDTTGQSADSIIRAVAKHKVDMAVVWGPLAGFFAQRYGNTLRLIPVEPEVDPPGLPFTFAISMGVRKGNTVLHDHLETILSRRKQEIDGILRDYGVPVLDSAARSGAGM